MSDVCYDTLMMGTVKLIMLEELGIPFSAPAPHMELQRLTDRALIEHAPWSQRIRHSQLHERDAIGEWYNLIRLDMCELFDNDLTHISSGRYSVDNDVNNFRTMCRQLKMRLNMIPEFKVVETLSDQEKKIIADDLENNFKNHALPVSHVYYLNGVIAGYITIGSTYYGKTLMYTSKTKTDKVTEHYILEYINKVAKETNHVLEKL